MRFTNLLQKQVMRLTNLLQKQVIRFTNLLQKQVMRYLPASFKDHITSSILSATVK